MELELEAAEFPSIQRFLGSFPLFAEMSETELREIESRSRVIRLRAGDSLFNPEEGSPSLYFLVSGAVKFVGGPGTKSLSDRLLAGDVFVKSALGLYMPDSMQAVAEETSYLVTVPAVWMQCALQARPSILAALTSKAARHLVRLHLASARLFNELEDSLFAAVAESAEFVKVKRGEILMREGDAADCLYIVAFGSLEVYRTDTEGKIEVVDLLRDGACVGEVDLLLNEPRSFDVRAWRTSLLVKVTRDCFEHVLRGNAALTLVLARALGKQLKRSTGIRRRNISVKTISLFRCVEEPYFTQFSQLLRAAFEHAGKTTAFLTASAFAGLAGNDERSADRFYEWLAEQEANSDLVLCQCDADDSQWTRLCNEQSDLVLFVCMPEQSAPSGQLRRDIESCKANGDEADLVLLRRPGTAPQETSRWLEQGGFKRHHHVVVGHPESHQRVARLVCGSSWGLVLGGGGARGLAHIGVVQALRDNGVPIDWVGGTSMGAIIAAQVAMGLSADDMLRATRKAYAGRGGSIDVTVPLVSMRSGRSTIQTLREMFHDRLIEDLPINYFCVSCNLTRANIVVHDRGPVWMWTRVSCSVPGLLPPVAHEGDLLVDGGLLENLPVETMRQRSGGYVIAADVSVGADLMVDVSLKPQFSFSGFSQVARKLKRQATLPDMVRILMRMAEVSSVRDSKAAGSPADLYLHPPLDSIGMTAFRDIDRIVAIGYEYALAHSKNWSAIHAGGAG